jgi:hypothetical protein
MINVIRSVCQCRVEQGSWTLCAYGANRAAEDMKNMMMC